MLQGRGRWWRLGGRVAIHRQPPWIDFRPCSLLRGLLVSYKTRINNSKFTRSQTLQLFCQFYFKSLKIKWAWRMQRRFLRSSHERTYIVTQAGITTSGTRFMSNSDWSITPKASENGSHPSLRKALQRRVPNVTAVKMCPTSHPRCKSLSVSEFRPLRGSAETAMTSVVDRVQIRWLLMLHSDQSCPDTPDSPGSKTGIHPLSAPLRVFEFAASLQFGKHLRPPRNAFVLELYWG